MTIENQPTETIKRTNNKFKPTITYSQQSHEHTSQPKRNNKPDKQQTRQATKKAAKANT